MKFKRGEKLPQDYCPQKDANNHYPPFKVGSYYKTECGRAVKCVNSIGPTDGTYAYCWQWDLPGVGLWWDEATGNTSRKWGGSFWMLAGEVDLQGNPLPDEYTDEPEDPEIVQEANRRTVQMLLQLTLERCGRSVGAKETSREMAEVLTGPAGELLLQAVQAGTLQEPSPKKKPQRKAARVKKATSKKAPEA